MGITVLPVVRRDAIKKDGTTSIYIRVTIQRRMKLKSTDYCINAKNWDESKKQVRKAEPLATSINLSLESTLLRMKDKVYQLLKDQEAVTHAKVFAAMKYYSIKSFSQYAYEEIASRDVTAHRKQNLNATVKMLEEFSPGLMVQDLTPALLQGFKNFIAKQDYAHNSKVGILSRVKSIVRKAKRDGLIKENPFEFVKIGSYKPRLDFLTYKDLVYIISSFHKLSEAESEAMKRFCFCCCTGFRYGDAEKLDYSHLRQCNRGYFFNVKQNKTDDAVIVPLSKLAEQFLCLDKKIGKVFKSYTNQYCNRILKSACKKIGVRKVTTHVARHSFVTISQEKGMRTNLAGKIAGQKSTKTTEGYTHYNLDMLFAGIEHWNR